MATHRFSVNVPNPESRAVRVLLRLEPSKPGDLSWLTEGGERTSLEVTASGIALEPCADRGKPSVALTLDPLGSVDVHVVVTTAPARRPGISAFHLIDERRGAIAGGVLLVCADPPLTTPPGQVVPSSQPCPIVLAKDIYAVRPDGAPNDKAAVQKFTAGTIVDLVASITNPTRVPIVDAQVYLEHLGVCSASFTPGTWNVGTLAPGAVFFATWRLHLTAWTTGTFAASIVAGSKSTDPVRLTGKFAVVAAQR